MKIDIINGPNLNLLGTREPDIYGSVSFDAFLTGLRDRFPGIAISAFQSNIEGELIDRLHQGISEEVSGIILNAGAYTHTSIAIADAISAIRMPVVEVHISNVFAREEFRKTSYIASRCIGSISGLGMESYALALQYFLNNQHA